MCLYIGMGQRDDGDGGVNQVGSLYDSLSSCPEIWEGAETDGMDSAEKLLHHPSAARSIRVRGSLARPGRRSWRRGRMRERPNMER